MIRRGFRYRLQPTEEQEKQFRSFSGVCRLVYNLALEQRRDWWQQYQATTGRSLNWAAQSREVTALRADFDWIAAVPRPCLEQALRDLERAYQSFYRREAGYPTPRKKGVNDTFRFQGRDIRTRKLNAKWSEVYLPKIGWVRYRDTRSLLGTIVNIAVSWAPNGWHVSFAFGYRT